MPPAGRATWKLAMARCEPCFLLAAQGLGFLDGDCGEAHRAAGQQAAEPRQVDRGDRGDLGIAADGLAVGQQHDRQARARHLDRARTDAVGDDVGALRMLDGRALEADAHAVGFLGDLVFGGHEGLAAGLA